ncbi:MAG: glycosyltransferase [Bdellovibrionales bacterium]|nr:glycosyltransferase [Bdellovibrionales bacterium]
MNKPPVTILHIILGNYLYGASRAMLATAKYTTEMGGYKHIIAGLAPWEPEALELAKESHVEVFPSNDVNEIKKACADADIVQVEWWNSPQMDKLLRSELPPMRLISWFHVAGDRDPQYITKEIVDFSDLALASSPQSYLCPSIQNLPTEIRLAKTGMVYDAADFARLEGFSPKPHDTFNIGYIGSLDWHKLHADFIEMSAAVNVPNVKFRVCGEGIVDTLKAQAAKLGATERFDFRGWVKDIRSEIELFDVYGYPLCEDTFASAELNLQEVMVAGVPPVVFPHGGIKQLVVNDFTGLVVSSNAEYSEAIEYLYNNQEERKRLGNNARVYAEQIFGGINAAKKFHKYYSKLLEEPKQHRVWGVDRSYSMSNQRVLLGDSVVDQKTIGARRFIDSLGETKELFLISYYGDTIDRLFEVERTIVKSSQLMIKGGLLPYRNTYANDPFILLWHGLAQYGAGNYELALSEFASSLQAGIGRPHVLWYASLSACQLGQLEISLNALNQLTQLMPEFSPASDLLNRIKSSGDSILSSEIPEICCNIY